MTTKYLLWLDLETTGSSTEDAIIELGATLTDLELKSIVNPGESIDIAAPEPRKPWEFSTLVEPHTEGLARLFRNKVVWDMHMKNGLLPELLERMQAPGSKPLLDPRQVSNWLINELKHNLGVGPHEAMLAGSGVAHFDSKMLRTYMPNLMSYLTYPFFDVGVIRRMVRWWAPGIEYPFEPDNKPHRGLDDVKLHLAEAQHYQMVLKSQNWGL